MSSDRVETKSASGFLTRDFNSDGALLRRESISGRFVESVVWLAVVSLSLLLLILIVGAPLSQAHGHTQFASTIYQAFSYVCHQIPSRSFHLAGHQFGVCSRCTGLYTGFAVAALIYPLARSLKRTDTPSRLWLMLATLPILIDFSLGYFSIWENTYLSRFLTGALLGSVAVFYIMPGLIELSSAIARRFR